MTQPLPTIRMDPDTRAAGDGRTPAFQSDGSRRRYLVVCLLTFLMFLGNSANALLAPILASNGLSSSEVGAVLSVYGATAILGTFVSGAVAERFGSLQTIRIAAALFLFAHLSQHFTVFGATGAGLSRLAQGFGYGLFLPAAMVYAKAQLTPVRAVYFFGIYSSMIPMPNVVGPTIAAYLLERYGPALYFPVTAIPMAVAAISFLLLPSGPVYVRAVQSRYVDILRCRGVALPFAAVFVTGVLFGIVPSYMAELLLDRQLPVALFFTTFTLVLFGSRFTLLHFFERLPKEQVVALALGLMAAAYATLVVLHDATGAVLAGVVFGLGYSLAYPRLSLWLSNLFPAERRDKPVSLFNAFFTFGSYVTPLLIGLLRTEFGVEAVMGVLAACGLACACLVAGLRFRLGRRGGAR